MLGAGTTAPARVAGRAVVSEDLIRMRRERNPELTRVTQRL
jgi:hypothetical protein